MNISKTKRRKILRILEKLKYYPATMHTDEALDKILTILEYNNGVIHVNN